jgi:hypothetical protein
LLIANLELTQKQIFDIQNELSVVKKKLDNDILQVNESVKLLDKKVNV